MYIKLTDGVAKRYTLRQLHKDNPNTSFPKEPTDTLLSGWDIYPYTQSDMPDCDEATQACDYLGLAETDGVYSENYVVRAKTQTELDADAVLSESKVKSLRNEMLFETDWWAVSDRVTTDAEIAYRQALRDIPQQAGFPLDVVWPVKPQEA